jgi:hypothetical protein
MIQYLKNFLAALSAPQCIQQVLLQSICQLAEQRPDACRKLLSHAEALKPELELQQLVQQAITRFLQTKGFVLHQDFQVDETGQWQLFNSAITSVLMELPKGDRLLITELLSLP